MVKSHRKNQTSSRSSSSFCTIFKNAGANKFWQEIPPQFVSKFLKNQVPDHFLLECASRGSWTVEVIKTEYGVFLKNGWRKFVKENYLREFDLLLFTYRGNARLGYQIFDKSGLEVTTSTLRTGEEDECKAKSKEERARIFMSKSQNYMFERRMKDYNVSAPFILYIPRDFGEEHFPPHKTLVTVKNADGVAWKVNCTCQNEKNFRLIGGWAAFAKENDLEIGDICVFELVAELTLRVRVFS